jgi:hypothetical protein
MDASQRTYLEQRHGLQATSRRRRGTTEPNAITDFRFDGSELSGWTLYRSRPDERNSPPSLRTLWHRGDPAAELLSIDLWECASMVGAHDQMLELLGNIQSDAVERRPGEAGIGDLAFALGVSMILFQRVNLVVFIRNAGPRIVPVEPVARAIDALLLQRSGG